MSNTRQLAAIMFTDIVGYTALMGNDEQRAFELLNKNRGIQKPVIEEFNGKWIKELGDGVMASFSTISDAVNAAVKIQEACNATNDFQLRIGIHQGEILTEDNDVFGDTVNIASRIQAIARPGSIYVSEAVHLNISNKRDLQTRFVREETLKNVKHPVPVYEVILTTVPSVAAEITLPTTSLKSIAVLPFANMSSDPEQEYFSDGITEEIITDLSHLHDMLVISRSSVMTFKQTQKKIREIAADLNVQYVLEGSVRKAGNNLRITAQLIDAGNDAHLWAEKYNGTLDDVFDIQEKVSRAIVDALKVTLTAKENSHISERPIGNIHAYDSFLRSKRELLKWNEEAFDRARKYIENAIEVTGENSLLYGAMGYVYWSYANLGFDSAENYKKAVEFANKSFSIDPQSSAAHLVLGNMNITAFGNVPKGLTHLKIVLKNNPNDFDALVWAGLAYVLMGKVDIAEKFSERLQKIDPLSPISYAWEGAINFYSGNFTGAIAPMRKAHQLEPENPFWPLFIAFSFAYDEKKEEAINFIDKELPEDRSGLIREMTYMIKPALQQDAVTVKNWINSLSYNPVNDCQFCHMLAGISAFAGLAEEGFYWLENAVRTGFYNHIFLSEHETAFKSLRSDDRFSKIIETSRSGWELLD